MHAISKTAGEVTLVLNISKLLPNHTALHHRENPNLRVFLEKPLLAQLLDRFAAY
jgi:hypothetical protein